MEELLQRWTDMGYVSSDPCDYAVDVVLIVQLSFQTKRIMHMHIQQPFVLSCSHSSFLKTYKIHVQGMDSFGDIMQCLLSEVMTVSGCINTTGIEMNPTFYIRCHSALMECVSRNTYSRYHLQDQIGYVYSILNHPCYPLLLK